MRLPLSDYAHYQAMQRILSYWQCQRDSADARLAQHARERAAELLGELEAREEVCLGRVVSISTGG